VVGIVNCVSIQCIYSFFCKLGTFVNLAGWMLRFVLDKGRIWAWFKTALNLGILIFGLDHFERGIILKTWLHHLGAIGRLALEQERAICPGRGRV